MDNFMDKLAQKFNAQDVIHANSEAETAEMRRLQQQVAEYEKILQEMRKLNYKNAELSDKIDSVLSDKAGDIVKVQKEEREILASLQNITEEQSRNFEKALAKSDEEAELAKQEMLERTKLNMEAVEELLKVSDDFTHKESVKVFRNVQAVVVDELKQQTQALTEMQHNTEKKASAACVFAVLTFILSLLSIALQVLFNMNIL